MAANKTAPKLKFEDCIGTIDKVIESHRHQWFLSAVPSIEWLDICQELRLHIFLKWHQYDQSKPLVNYLHIVIKNQIFNKLRDNYFSLAKPCTKCSFADGEHGCLWESNKSRVQGPVCPLYAKWLKNKKFAADVKLPVSLVHHELEVENLPSDFVDIHKYFVIVKAKARKYLSRLEYKIFKMLYVDKKSEEDVAKMMGLKTTEKYRSAGYRQIATHKQRIFEKIKKMLEKEDILQS